MTRLDVFLVDNQYFSTRNKAQMAITNGDVSVNGKTVTKNGFEINEEDVVAVIDSLKYVSRSGLKLEQALKSFKVEVNGKIALDIGASTGGFTDCLLQNGAAFVYSLDVGRNQLVKTLRNNPLVESREGINCRYLNKNDFSKELDLVVMDVSFISCTLMFGAISNLLSSTKEVVVLIKPQFEVGPKYINKHGIATNQQAVLASIKNCIEVARKNNLFVQDIVISSVKGREGNQEYLAYFIKDGKNNEIALKSRLNR